MAAGTRQAPGITAPKHDLEANILKTAGFATVDAANTKGK